VPVEGVGKEKGRCPGGCPSPCLASEHLGPCDPSEGSLQAWVCCQSPAPPLKCLSLRLSGARSG
jgi:hypothetical protein